ncbi:MAG: right-handed parallel beta-helix repeat-containing protein [Gemmatimonadetes bacterium]|nr:right-handed parallel beta-helix repeat-containing protein [Gemmatimonadota bacterium]
MKYVFSFVHLLFGVAAAEGQVESPSEKVVITVERTRTEIRTDENGVLHLNVSENDALAFKARGSVRYSEFGARGDGATDDIDAIAAAHAFANQHDLSVRADEGATYYIGGKERTAVIQTDTDFGAAAFTIDDREVQNRGASVFTVASRLQALEVKGISSLKRNQDKLNVSLPAPSLITATNSHVRRYIRFGPNQNDGSPQTDIFAVDRDGKVDEDTPIIWDFDQITEITALPMDETTLHITGGRFTTIANQAESRYTYYSRNFAIRRSNVVVDGLEHRVIGEGDHGAPYSGFINIRDCANVTVRNTVLTGRKTYRTIGSAGQPVSMGSYDILVNRAVNVSFVNCTQTNDINDHTYWGIMASNYSKNILYDNCKLSRFDAHMGVANATIRNSTLGYMGINAIGTGVLRVENSTIYGTNLINLRSDYGSTWQGEIVIRNSVFVPAGGRPVRASLIGGRNSGNHDFGYTAYLPERITIESLHIDDSSHPDDYPGPAIFADFNPEMTGESYRERFPYVRTSKVILKNVTTASGKPLRVSDHPFMFKDVQIDAQ